MARMHLLPQQQRRLQLDEVTWNEIPSIAQTELWQTCWQQVTYFRSIEYTGGATLKAFACTTPYFQLYLCDSFNRIR